MVRPLSVVAIVLWLAAVAGLHAAHPQPQAKAASPAFTSTALRATLDQYCIACHNQRARTAGLALDTIGLDDIGANGETWEAVVRKLQGQTMPPVGSRRPDEATYRTVVSWLEDRLDEAAAAHPKAGRTEAFHRLNRSEYQNAIRDLLAVETDVTTLLPADNTYEHGFDNNGDVLSVSPDLLARYLSAARKISRLAVGIPPAGPIVDMYRIHPNLLQGERLSEDLPFGSRGGAAIRHNFPVAGEYVVRVRLHRNFSDYILGFGSTHQIEIRLDGKRLDRFAVGGEAPGQMAPLSFAGNIAGSDEWEQYMLGGDSGLEVRFTAPAGPHVVGVSFARKVSEDEGVFQPRQRGYGLFVDEQHDAVAAVDQIAIGGPYRVDGPGDSPSRRRIFVCQPEKQSDEPACARRIISTLAQRAYRRPVTGTDIDALMAFYDKGRQSGSFDQGLQFAVERMLVDPEFLFRIEQDRPGLAPGENYRLNDVELASRLSFFLWSSIPDEALLQAAIDGRLHEPAVLEQHVRRMLADPRSEALVDNFASQWLRLRNLDGVQRESADFPEWDENLRESFRRETELFVGSTIREDRSVLDLLGADYSFLNERLARHYGVPGIYGDRFRRVTFANDSPRGGLLGQGGLLMVTSHPNQTSPVLRGKWLLESILGAPPPEPPPNVPALPDRGEGGRPASVRERLELHRKNPVCSSCHAPMDPLGFALENFDPIGRWRDTSEAGTPIDATAMMPSGVKFEGPAGLRALLLGQGDQFAATVTEKLLAYALGRGLEYYDQPVVRDIARHASRDNYRWSAIVAGIATSTPFQMRQTRLADPPVQAAADADH